MFEYGLDLSETTSCMAVQTNVNDENHPSSMISAPCQRSYDQWSTVVHYGPERRTHSVRSLSLDEGFKTLVLWLSRLFAVSEFIFD
jgi:hypothetical protein